MSKANGDSADGETIFEGYSNYRKVSGRIAMSIEDAVDAYATLAAMHAEGAKVKPKEAARARRAIGAAIMRVRVELDQDQEEKDLYEEILKRWEEGEGKDDGLLEQFREVQLSRRCPEWLHQLVYDLRQAGWEIGYLQSGRTTRAEDPDPAESEARSVLKD